jgi:hypothetical protein
MAQEMGLLPGGELHIETDAGARVCRVNALRTKGEYTVEVTAGMGMPTFAKKTVKLADGLAVEGVEVSTGNPHFVIAVDNAEFSVAGRAWTTIGAEICVHPDFPHQTNVEFFRVTGLHEIEIRIFERGVGPTTSSGTGTSAASTSGHLARIGLLSSACHSSRWRTDHRVGGTGRGVEAHRAGSLDCTRRGMGSVITLLKPQAVPPDAQVAVVSPASTPQPDRVESGFEALRELGYLPQASEHILARGPLYFAGTPEMRLSDLHHAFADDRSCALSSPRVAATDRITCSTDLTWI